MAESTTPPGNKTQSRINTTYASAYPMGTSNPNSTPPQLQLTGNIPNAPNAERTRDTRPEDDGVRQPVFRPDGGKKRRGKKSRKSRKGKKPRKGKKSRKNKRTKRR